MRPIVTDRATWSVCLSSVCHSLEPCKNGWTDRGTVWGVDSGETKEPCIIWRGSRSLMRMGSFEGKTSHARQMAGWKSKINIVYSLTGSLLWRNAAPSAFELQETMLKSDKICCTFLVIQSTNFLNAPRMSILLYGSITVVGKNFRRLWNLPVRTEI